MKTEKWDAPTGKWEGSTAKWDAPTAHFPKKKGVSEKKDCFFGGNAVKY